jgi:hypothetical protein
MNARRIIPATLLVLAGILSLATSFYGALSLVLHERQIGAGLHLLYSVPLILLFPFFCLAMFWPRLSAILQFADAFTFLAATLSVNIRACASYHPCPDFLHIAVGSFLQGTTMIPFVIAVLQTLSMYMRSPVPTPRISRTI